MAEPTITGEQPDERPTDSSIQPESAQPAGDGTVVTQPGFKSAVTRVEEGDLTEVTLNDSPASTDSAATSLIEASEAIARELTDRQKSGQPFAPDHSTIVQIVQGVLKASSNARIRIRPPSSRRHVAGYEIISELGRGAVGVVYQARQTGLNRLVALKMILAGGHASRSTLARFAAEAAAVASLQHGNIVQIYEIGEHEGMPFFSLEYCAGGSLADRLKGTPVAPVSAARIAVKLARAVHYAHGSNVVHRDLKPANILLHPRDDAGRAAVQNRRDEPFDFDSVIYKITDFGLAKRLDEASQTKTGAVLGTPSYMAPEQASGKIHDIGPAADVYALGAMLYEFLTGRPPFRAATPMDTVVQVINDEPVAPTRLQSGVPVDLETIALKCLQKDPDRRYDSAAALAEDLQRFLDGKPIVARPVGRIERVWRWCQRNPVVAGLTALAVVLLLAGTAVSSFFAHQSKIRAEQASQNEQAARRNLYVAQMNLVQRAWDDIEMARVRDLLSSQMPSTPHQPDFRGPEWHYWDRLAHRELAILGGHAGGTTCVAFLPDGRRLASGGRDHCVRIWDLATNAEVAQLTGHSHEIAGISFLPGDRLISAGTVLKSGDKGPYVDGGEVRVWDLKQNALLNAQAIPTDSEIKSLAVSGNGEQAAVACQDGAIHVLRTADCSHCRTIVGKRAAALATALSPDGKLLAASFEDGSVALWKLPDGERLPIPERIGMIPWSLAFAPDGRRLAVGGAPLETADRQFRRQGDIRVIDSTSGRVLAVAAGHAGPVLHVEFSPDGHRLVSGSHDRTVRIWDSLTGRREATLQGHEQLVTAASFSRESRLIASGSLDGSIRIWSPVADNAIIERPGMARCTPALSPDGRLLACCSFLQEGNKKSVTIDILDTQSKQPIKVLTTDAAAITALWFAADSRTLMAGCAPGGSQECRLRAWSIKTGTLMMDVGLPIHDFTRVVTSPTGSHWALLHDNRTLLVAAETGAVEKQWTAPAPLADVSPVGPDEWRAVCVDPDKRVAIVWSTSGQTVGLDDGAGSIKNATISRDGGLVAAGCTDGTVRIWSAATGRPSVPPMTGHLWTVGAVAFNRDGTRLASAGTGFDGTVRLWDVRTGQELLVRENGSAIEPQLQFGPRDDCLLIQTDRLSLRDLRALSPAEQKERVALAAALFHTCRPLDRPAILAAIRDDELLNPEVRDQALQLAERWLDEPGRFGRAAWDVLRSPYSSSESCRQAREWADRYAQDRPLAPERGVAIALSSLRTGNPAEAVELLAKLEPELTDLWQTRARAVLALALERLGQHERAGRFIQLLADAGDGDELVAEARQVIRMRDK